MERWERSKGIQSRIEVFIKVGGEAFGWDLTRWYTQRVV